MVSASAYWIIVALVAGAGMWIGIVNDRPFVWAVFAAVFAGYTIFEAIRVRIWRFFGKDAWQLTKEELGRK